MGQTTRGIYPEENGTWHVDKWWRKDRLRQRGFTSYKEAEGWLIKQLADRRTVALHGERVIRTFDEAAAYYLLKHQDKASIVTEAILLKSIMPTIGAFALHQVHDSSLAPYITARLAAGKAHKTINLALGVVRHILSRTSRNQTSNTMP